MSSSKSVQWPCANARHLIRRRFGQEGIDDKSQRTSTTGFIPGESAGEEPKEMPWKPISMRFSVMPLKLANSSFECHC